MSIPTAGKDYGEMDGMIQFAREKIKIEHYDVVLMGHRHRPYVQNIEKGLYINLGDWITYNTYAEFNGKKIELKTWK